MKNALEIAAHTDREALSNFVEGVKIAESAAGQMAFYTNDPDWLKVRLALEGVREVAVSMAQRVLWMP